MKKSGETILDSSLFEQIKKSLKEVFIGVDKGFDDVFKDRDIEAVVNDGHRAFNLLVCTNATEKYVISLLVMREMPMTVEELRLGIERIFNVRLSYPSINDACKNLVTKDFVEVIIGGKEGRVMRGERNSVRVHTKGSTTTRFYKAKINFTITVEDAE